MIPSIVLVVSFLTVVLAVPSGAREPWPLFYADDPVWEDNDRHRIQEPIEIELSQYYDFIENTFFNPGGSDELPSQNVNSVDEVPNSCWFTNRHAVHRMSQAELARGSRRGSGPDMESPWVVIRGKSEGITPGFVVRDGHGDIYFVKFDPKNHPEMATSAEAIATGFFYAIGYHVPENFLAEIDTSFFRLGHDAQIKDNLGSLRRMTEEDLRTILQRVPIRSDGSIRVIASKAIDGKPLGHFRYYGTRPDDGNDVIPHQHRRELRGLRVFASWLNHDDARSINSLDVFVHEDDEGYVKHYLIDFGSCLGSGSVMQQTRRGGNEYMWDVVPTLKTIASLGLWVRPYLKIRYPDYPVIGRFEPKAFRPERWVPEYPNAAFRRMDDRDAFWAAKIVMSFTDNDIRTLVGEGRISDPAAEDYMVRTLIERRDKIGSYYLNRLNPLDEFVIEGDSVRFTNLAVKYGFGEPPIGYSVSWWSYDNERRQPRETILTQNEITGGAIPIPPGLSDTLDLLFYFVEILPSEDAPRRWRNPMRVFFRVSAEQIEIAGIMRDAS